MAKVRRQMFVVLVLTGLLLMFCCGARITTAANSGDQPQNFQYYHAWASTNGETHFAKCKMQGFNLSVYTSLPQYFRSDFGGTPSNVVFSELPVGFSQPLHSPPSVQFVVTLSGSWYVTNTDGSTQKFRRGDVLFEDTTKSTPSQKQPLHYSGTLGKKPCHMMFAQISRPPQVDNPCPF